MYTYWQQTKKALNFIHCCILALIFWSLLFCLAMRLRRFVGSVIMLLAIYCPSFWILLLTWQSHFHWQHRDTARIQLISVNRRMSILDSDCRCIFWSDEGPSSRWIGSITCNRSWGSPMIYTYWWWWRRESLSTHRYWLIQHNSYHPKSTVFLLPTTKGRAQRKTLQWSNLNL